MANTPNSDAGGLHNLVRCVSPYPYGVSELAVKSLPVFEHAHMGRRDRYRSAPRGIQVLAPSLVLHSTVVGCVVKLRVVSLGKPPRHWVFPFPWPFLQ